MSKDSNRIAIALITDERDNVLMGRRNDNSLFTQPGGHIHIGEDPHEGMARELKEETGLDAKKMKIVCCCKKGKMLIYLFRVDIDPSQKVDVSGDPDNECNFWYFIDPNEVKEELHVPIEENITLQHWMDS